MSQRDLGNESSFRRVRYLLRQDAAAYANQAAELMSKKQSIVRTISIMLTPSLLCNLLYRLSHWLWTINLRVGARLVSSLNLLVHRVWISPDSSIGPGLYIPHPAGIVFEGSAGSHLSLFANAVVGERWGSNAGVQRPTLGDHVTVGANAVVMGQLSIGSYATIAPMSVIDTDVSDNSVAISPRAHRTLHRTAGDGGYISDG